jgi:hypothetical protein
MECSEPAGQLRGLRPFGAIPFFFGANPSVHGYMLSFIWLKPLRNAKAFLLPFLIKLPVNLASERLVSLSYFQQLGRQ